MNWFFMAKGAVSDERKGPVPHPQFVAMVQQGKISQTTLACSPELTGGQWLPIKDIAVIQKALATATAERQRALEEQQRRASEEQAKAVPAPTVAQPSVAPPATTPLVVPQFRPTMEPSGPMVQPYQPPHESKPFVQGRPLPSLHVRPVFQHYWMPDYLQAIWYLTLAFCALWFLVVATIAIGAAAYSKDLTEALVPMVTSLVITGPSIVVVILAVRFVLELYAIFYDIRSFVKRQTDLLEQSQGK